MITDKKTFYLSLAVLIFSLSGLTPFWKLVLTILLTLILMALSVRVKIPNGLPKNFLHRTTPQKIENVVSRPTLHQEIVKKEAPAPAHHKEVIKEEPLAIPEPILPVVAHTAEPKAARIKKVVKRPRKRVVKKKTSPQTNNPEIRF